MKYTTFTKLKALFISIRPKTTPLGMISVYIGGLVAGAAYTSPKLFLAVITTFFITAASMTYNDYFDWQIDKINHPQRPIPQGIITPKEMLYFSIILFALGSIISFFINMLSFVLILVGILLLNLYELYSKNRGILSNITVAFISAMSFTFGGAAVNNPFSTVILSTMTFFVILGREIIMDIRDTEGDKTIRRSLPVQIGKKNASYVACIFLLISLILTPFPYLLNILNIGYIIIIIPVGFLTMIGVVQTLRDVNNAAFSASLIRIALAIALVSFIIGIVF
ncbi:MAG: UbiA family prenyltransferase [Thermoplasmatota archaeon]